MQPVEVVITGLGVVSPIGIGSEPFWQRLMAGTSGVGQLNTAAVASLPVRIGGAIPDFKPQEFIRPLKSLKVMCRDIQLAVASAHLAATDAKLAGNVAPERLGVLFGADMMFCPPEEVAAAFRACLREGHFDFSRWGDHAISEFFPLWMLRYLPNMPACHVGIAHDARGPNNSIVLGEVSSLLAIAEAAAIIRRGHADVMIAGGTGARLNPTMCVRNLVHEVSHRNDDPAGASRPFDRDRDGCVHGEGSASLILESRAHAEARGAPILARLLAETRACEPHHPGQPVTGTALRHVMARALELAELPCNDLGHVNAHGISGRREDAVEAQAIAEVVGDVPVTAPKSYFGDLGAGSGAVELAASVLGLVHGLVPPTLNYETPDPDCPVNVVHGEPLAGRPATALVLNQAAMGQAAAVVVGR